MGNDCCKASDECKANMAFEPHREGSEHIKKVYRGNQVNYIADDDANIHQCCITTSQDGCRIKDKYDHVDPDLKQTIDDRMLTLKVKY